VDGRRGERGQVLVIAALIMTALLGFLALIIDVGNAYAQRRFMQNAADAASVAGARVLAANLGTGASDAAVLGAINTYLASNGSASSVSAGGPTRAWYVNIAGANVRAIGGGSVPAVAAGGTPTIVGVKVEAGKQVSTYFAGVLGYPTLTVKASGSAAYNAPSSVFLNSIVSGVPVGPLVLDEQAYQNALSLCGGYGAPLKFSLYIDTPSDCATGPDMHFSYSTLNIGSNCSNDTVKELAEDLISNPSSMGSTSVVLDVTPIQICHGARLSNSDLVVSIGRPFVVPLIRHTVAQACHPKCDTPVVRFAYLRITGWGGNGSNMWYDGYWVDPTTQPPMRGSGISTSSSPIWGPVAYALFR
jgi:Flp pilus assembly protein TadG